MPALISARLGHTCIQTMCDVIFRVFTVSHSCTRVHLPSLQTPTNWCIPGRWASESIYYFERAIDLALGEMVSTASNCDAETYRPDEIPYMAAGGMEYDSGDFPAVLEDALKASDWDGFSATRSIGEEKVARGRGIATYLEATGAPAREMGRIRFEEDAR